MGEKPMTFRMHWMGACAALLAAAGPVIAQAPADQPLYAGRLDAFRGLSLEAKVQLLADREEIRDLISTYAGGAGRVDGRPVHR
jgi:hypothetical protein